MKHELNFKIKLGACRLHKAKQQEAIFNAALKKAEEDKDFVKPSQVGGGGGGGGGGRRANMRE